MISKKKEKQQFSAKKKQAKSFSVLRGFKDVLPEEHLSYDYLRDTAKNLLEGYGYGYIETPIVEYTSLYKRTTGEHTDVVSKEMFSFEDKGGDGVSLRPEFTPGIARAYTERGMINRPQPVKLFSMGPVFRYDRPQAGRYRQFNQLDIEIIGDKSACSDAEIIYISYLLCKKVGIDPLIQVNSLGSLESREEYTKILKEYYKTKKKLLCEDCKLRLGKNTLRLLDCKEQSCKEIALDAPQLVDHLDEDSKHHFVKVLEHLDEAQVPYELNPYIVRGLDYYNKTAFEIISSNDSSPDEAPEEGVSLDAKPSQQIAIGGGGRYDGLFELMGGRPTPAVGMAFGVERVIEASKKLKEKSQKKEKIDVFLAQLGEGVTKHALPLYEKLRDCGIKVRANFSKDGLKGQLELADKLGVVYAVILGQKELLDETIIIRDMENGIQEVVSMSKVAEEIKKRLKR